MKISHCYYKTVDDKDIIPKEIKKGAVIFLKEGQYNEFFITKDSFNLEWEVRQKIKDEVVNSFKWAYIYNTFFEQIEKTLQEEKKNLEEEERKGGAVSYSELERAISTNLWGNLSGGTQEIKAYKLENRYFVGNKIKFQLRQNTPYYYGYKQRVEIFSDTPGKGFYFYIVPIAAETKINYAYFEDSEKLKFYKEDKVKLTLSFHGYDLPKNRTFNQHPRLNEYIQIEISYLAKVYLLELNENTRNLKTTEELAQNNLWKEPIIYRFDYNDVEKNDYNNYIFHEFIPDEKWDKNEKNTKEFTVAVEIYKTVKGVLEKEILVRNFAEKPTNDLITYSSKLMNIKDIDDKESISSRFIVSGNIMDKYVNFEIKKKNMIQYVGDVDYYYREYDPCGYSKIIVKELGDEKRAEFIIFSEPKDKNDRSLNDRTNEPFDVINGDNPEKPKEVIIKVEGLSTKVHDCEGILLDDNQKHNDVKNIFNMSKIWTARTEKDYFNLNFDKAYSFPNNKNSSGIFKKNNYENQDVKYKKDENHEDDYDQEKSHEIEGGNVQRLVEGVDYQMVRRKPESASFTFKTLIYNYNKEGKYWMFNYFILNEEMAQTYFVPISTCRYPNQIAKIRVFPDIEWTFHINYGMKNPLYYRDTWVDMRQHRVEDAFNRGQAGDIDGYDGTLETEFKLSLEAKWNGSETEKLERQIAGKVDALIKCFLKIKQFVNQVTGGSRANSASSSVETDSRILARMRRTPLNIEVLSPQLAIGAGWSFKTGMVEKKQGEKVAFTLGLIAKADPIIGAEAVIDLIAWGKKLHPAAYAVITALDLLASAADANVRFDLKFYGKLVIEGNIELSKLKKEGSLKAEGQFGFELILLAKATGKLERFFIETDYDFEARGTASGYFSLGLSAGMDDHKGLYLQPIVEHSGIKITLIIYAIINNFKRIKSKEFVIIDKNKLELNKIYMNK